MISLGFIGCGNFWQAFFSVFFEPRIAWTAQIPENAQPGSFDPGCARELSTISQRHGRGGGVGRGLGVGTSLGVGVGLTVAVGVAVAVAVGVAVAVAVGVGEADAQGLTAQVKISIESKTVAPSDA